MLNRDQVAYLSFIERNPISGMYWLKDKAFCHSFEERTHLLLESQATGSSVFVPVDAWKDVLPYVERVPQSATLMYLTMLGMTELDTYREKQHG